MGEKVPTVTVGPSVLGVQDRVETVFHRTLEVVQWKEETETKKWTFYSSDLVLETPRKVTILT